MQYKLGLVWNCLVGTGYILVDTTLESGLTNTSIHTYIHALYVRMMYINSNAVSISQHSYVKAVVCVINGNDHIIKPATFTVFYSCLCSIWAASQ